MRGRRPSDVAGRSGPSLDGEGRNRTGDTTIFSRVLYQLSYLAARAGMVARSRQLQLPPPSASLALRTIRRDERPTITR